MHKALMGLIVVAGLLPGVAACDGLFGPRVCTLIGCSDQLTVNLSGAVADSFVVIATAPGQASRRIECPANDMCGAASVMFEDFAPGSVTITYESASGATTKDFAPSYAVLRPNGEDCPPSCRQATVSLEVSS